MRVGMDVRKYSDLGIGTYIQNLVRIFQLRQELDLVYFASDENKQNLGNSLNVKMITDNSPKYSLRELISLSSKANKQKLDLYHSPHYTFPLNLKMPGVVTIFDLIHLRFKETFSLPKRMYAFSVIQHACSASSAVIVSSEFGKKELLKSFKVNEKKIRVIPLGVNYLFFENVADERKEKFLQKYAITKPYILYTGSLKPHKNVPVLLKAFKKVLAAHDVQLVFTGENLSDEPLLMAYINQHQLNRSIINLGKIDQHELITAYHSAAMVALPSFYEGFGFSMLEAMASGVPAIGARAASITEVVGNAGLLFDPNDEDDLYQQILKILEDPIFRSSVIQKGKERAKTFTWEQCAEKTLSIYKEVSA